MNLKHGFAHGFMFLMSGVLLAACGPSDQEKAAAEQQAKAKKIVKKVQPTDPLAGMSAAVTGSKGTLPVDVRFELLDRPEPNHPVTVRMVFAPTIDLITVRAVVKPMAGVQVAGDTQVKFDEPKNGEIKEYKFIATPTTTGILLVGIDITVTRDTGDTLFTYSLPIPVPDTSAATASASAVAK